MSSQNMNGHDCDKETIRNLSNGDVIKICDPNTDSIGTLESDSQLNSAIRQSLEEKISKENMKCMNYFDPKLRKREKREWAAILNKLNFEKKRIRKIGIHDEFGLIKAVGKDVCDCFDENCPGCHFPCPKCRSCKCGHECRNNRKWMYESIEDEATNITVLNPNYVESKMPAKQSSSFNYTEASMIRAVEDVTKHNIPIRKAAKKFGVPRQTLKYRIDQLPCKAKKMGPTTALLPEEEKHICKWIEETVRSGFQVTQTLLTVSVETNLEQVICLLLFPTEEDKGKYW